jgi:penicillin-binding protein 1C
LGENGGESVLGRAERTEGRPHAVEVMMSQSSFRLDLLVIVSLLPIALRRLAVPVGALLLLVASVTATRLPQELREPVTSGSIIVEDRDGRPLREVRASDGTRARWVRRRDLSETTVRAILAAEDARFYAHPGVDPLALVRAAALDLAHGRVVSGGSTLTMQLARLVRPHPRSVWGKLHEMVLALRIEASLSKDEILEQYVNRATFGPNVRGIGAASRAYFDKSLPSLSMAESALLAGLPRGPSLYQVTRHPERARRRRDRVLDRMLAQGWVEPAAAERAKAEPIETQSRSPVFGAPHLVAGLVSGHLSRVQPGLEDALSTAQPLSRLRSTLDARLQREAEAQVEATVKGLRAKGVTAASAVILENASGDVLGYVGSPDALDAENGGQNDGARAERQPGSTLKPFLYELAMETLGFDPSTRLPDVELHLRVEGGADYAPRDYDGRFRGPVRLREALGSSLNVPAVWTAERVGVDVLLTRLRDLGFASLTEDATYYGPGLALGDGEVTLLELARAYATLARGGVDVPLRLVSSVDSAGGSQGAILESGVARRVMPERFANMVVDVLKDHDARVGSFGERSVLDFPFEVAAKTGTSKGYRDNWTVGFTPTVTVAVWVGNFDGAPMTNVSGITGAGPLFHALMDAAMRGRARQPLPMDASAREGLERVEVCALSGEIAGSACPHRLAEWRAAGSMRTVCTMHARTIVDRRNGLRAGPGCADGDVEERIFERFPPEFASWADAAGRPIEPHAWSPNCVGAGDDSAARDGDTSAPRIAYPLPGARFVIDPDRPRELQRLDVKIVAPDRARQATLVVDGETVARVGAPFDASWALRQGEHELVAEVDGQRSAAVRVRVRE